MKKSATRFGAYFREKTAAAGLQPGDIVKAMHVANGTVSRWFRGRGHGGQNPSIAECYDLAPVLGVPEVEVLEEAGHLNEARRLKLRIANHDADSSPDRVLRQALGTYEMDPSTRGAVVTIVQRLMAGHQAQRQVAMNERAWVAHVTWALAEWQRTTWDTVANPALTEPEQWQVALEVLHQLLLSPPGRSVPSERIPS